MSKGKVYLVGSVPLSNAEQVFETVSAVLGPRIKRIPDGETGPRLDWIFWLEPIFANCPALQKSGEFFQLHAQSPKFERYRLRSGYKPQDVTFDNLFYADIAKQSFAAFKRLKDAGRIGGDVKFQVDLVPAHSLLWLFLVDALHAPIDPIYNEAVKREVDKIAAAIPHDELAIQFDVASAVFARLERNETSGYGKSKQETQETSRTSWSTSLTGSPPISICSFTFATAIPTTATWSSRPTWRIWSASLTASRRILLVLSSCSTCPFRATEWTTLYFAPLTGLKLGPGTELCLGLVHYTDGLDGSKKRLATAKKFVSDFLIATECGFGRRDPGSIPELLRLHREMADLL